MNQMLFYNLLNQNVQMVLMVGFNVRLEAQMKVNRRRPMRSSELGSNKVLSNHLRKTGTTTRPLAIQCFEIGVLLAYVEGAALTPILAGSMSRQKPQFSVGTTASWEANLMVETKTKLLNHRDNLRYSVYEIEGHSLVFGISPPSKGQTSQLSPTWCAKLYKTYVLWAITVLFSGLMVKDLF